MAAQPRARCCGGAPSLGCVVSLLVCAYAVVVGSQMALVLWPQLAFVGLERGGSEWVRPAWDGAADAEMELWAVTKGAGRPSVQQLGRFALSPVFAPLNATVRVEVSEAALRGRASVYLQARFGGGDGGGGGDSVATATPLVREYGGEPHVLRRARVHLVRDATEWPPGAPTPPDVRQALRAYASKAPAGGYAPFPMCTDSVWAVREDHEPLTGAGVVEVLVEYTEASLAWYRFSLQMGASLRQIDGVLGVKEADDVRSMFVDTAPALMALTLAVSVLHMALDVMAIREDISFWRGKSSFEGVSASTLGMSLASQVVLVLFLVDEGASWLVTSSSVATAAVTAWKVARVSRARAAGDGAASSPHDRTASAALRRLVPALLACSFAYSWAYRPLLPGARGAYSWALATLAGAIYAFGFFMMCPQLYMNYKLKSVRALSWHALVYRAANTFIDDLFAVMIARMPTAHRVAAFRDDVVFVVYLYQRWIYRTDLSRGGAAGDKEKEE